MAPFILILIYASLNQGGPAMQEFGSREACENALQKVKSQFEGTMITFAGTCVPKHIKESK